MKPRFSDNLELGRYYESLAQIYYCRLGYNLIGKNLWIGRREIDLLFLHEMKNQVMMVEVRGRRSLDKKPIHFLTYSKKRKLYQLACSIQKQYPQKRIKLQLIEFRGELPSSPLELGILRLRAKLKGIFPVLFQVYDLF